MMSLIKLSAAVVAEAVSYAGEWVDAQPRACTARAVGFK